MSVSLKLPFAIVQRTHLARLQPARNAVKMERMIADAPSHGTLLAGGGRLIRLALDAQVHDVVATDGTVVDYNVPRPNGGSVILAHLKTLSVSG